MGTGGGPLTTAGMKRIGDSEVYYDRNLGLYYHSPQGRKPHLMYSRGGGWFSCSREDCNLVHIDQLSSSGNTTNVAPL